MTERAHTGSEPDLLFVIGTRAPRPLKWLAPDGDSSASRRPARSDTVEERRVCRTDFAGARHDDERGHRRRECIYDIDECAWMHGKLLSVLQPAPGEKRHEMRTT